MRDIEKEQMGEDLLAIFIGLTVLLWRVVKRIYKAAQQQPPREQPPQNP